MVFTNLIFFKQPRVTNSNTLGASALENESNDGELVAEENTEGYGYGEEQPREPAAAIEYIINHDSPALRELAENRIIQLMSAYTDPFIPPSIDIIDNYGRHRWNDVRRHSDPSALLSFTNPHHNSLSRMLTNYIDPLFTNLILFKQPRVTNSNTLGASALENELNDGELVSGENTEGYGYGEEQSDSGDDADLWNY